jgi:hypothetical protein
MNYTNKSIIPNAQHDMPAISDIEYSFDNKTETLLINVSYSPIVKGKLARKIWKNLTEFESPYETLSSVKKIAADITGVSNYNDKSRKSKQAFFRYLIVWFAFRKMKFSLKETRKICGFTNANVYHCISIIESDDESLLFDQIIWRRDFMNKIKELS